MSDIYFRGRKVNYSGRYPRVWHPEHPVSNNGLARIHRIVGYEKYGEDVFDEDLELHHKDGDRENWGHDNIILMDKHEHNLKHQKPSTFLCICNECGAFFTRRPSEANKNKFCSDSCMRRSREKIDWPSTEWLVEMSDRYGFLALSRRLGVSDNAIRKRIRNH